MTLCNLIEEIKQNITDAQYMSMLEELRKIHHGYTWNFTYRHDTPDRVVRLIKNIVRSGVSNPGKLAHILRGKGHSYEDYLYESFGEWMCDIGIHINNNTITL